MEKYPFLSELSGSYVVMVPFMFKNPLFFEDSYHYLSLFIVHFVAFQEFLNAKSIPYINIKGGIFTRWIKRSKLIVLFVII
jgi:hypothetical protein